VITMSWNVMKWILQIVENQSLLRDGMNGLNFTWEQLSYLGLYCLHNHGLNVVFPS
jgi:hypothetical protein